MGVDISATHTVFFIAAVVIAVGTIGVFNQSAGKFTNEVAQRSDGLSKEFATDIRIVNDPGDMPNNPLILYVLNTGTASLTPSETVILVDGQVQTTLTTDVLGTTEEVWRSGQVLQITMTGLNLANGDHRVRVIAENGVADTLRFSI